MFGPNISGVSATGSVWMSMSSTGLLSTTITNGGYGGTGGGDLFRGYLGINASKSSLVYTDNGKVHVLSLAINFIIKT